MPSSTRPAGQIREVWTSDSGSMAKETAASRWPKIVQDMIEDIEQAMAKPITVLQIRTGLSAQKELKKLKEEIQDNDVLTPLKMDGKGDIEEFNHQLALLGKCTWLDCPWMWGECYLYRRVQTIFALSQYWTSYDVFKRQKDSTFVKSRAAVEEISNRYVQVLEHSEFLSTATAEAKRLLFEEMTEIALWGNATDLSLLSHLSLEEIQSLQGRESIAKNQRNIVDNDIEEAWAYLTRPLEGAQRVDIVLDNAGFEFFTDVIYALYLLKSRLATEVHFHVKDFPWFVSDVTPPDVDSLLAHLQSPITFPNRGDIDVLLSRFRKHLDTEKIIVQQNPFWTTGYSFHEMPTVARDLFEELRSSSLVIFKGDLNYRKLTKDSLWPHTTPFQEAIGTLGRDSGVKVLALRTNKSDVCVGIQSQDKVNALNREAPGGAWIRNGKYAVISFSNGDKGH